MLSVVIVVDVAVVVCNVLVLPFGVVVGCTYVAVAACCACLC